MYDTGLFSYIDVSSRVYTKRDSICNEVRQEYNMCIKTYLSIKRALNNANSDLYTRKETYLCKKRPICMIIDLCVRKKTYIREKRHIYAKRDLFIRKKVIHMHIRGGQSVTCSTNEFFFFWRTKNVGGEMEDRGFF